MLNENVKLHHKETIISLKYCSIKTKQSKNAEEWMAFFRIKANECECKEEAGSLKEQFICGINDDYYDD